MRVRVRVRVRVTPSSMVQTVWIVSFECLPLVLAFRVRVFKGRVLRLWFKVMVRVRARVRIAVKVLG